MSNKNHPVLNGIIATVIGGLILAAILNTWFREILTELLGVFAKPFVYFAQWISASTAVYNWVLLMLMILGLITICRWLSALWNAKTSNTVTYCADNIFGVIWRWDGSPYRPNKLCCFCPQCDAELVYQEQREDYIPVTFLDHPHFTQFVCENCKIRSSKLNGNLQAAIACVEREIRRRFRTGDWPKETPNHSFDQTS